MVSSGGFTAEFEPHDHYGDGAWYDAEYVHIRGDVPYYAGVAGATNGAILELACGTGRVYPVSLIVLPLRQPSLIEQQRDHRAP